MMEKAPDSIERPPRLTEAAATAAEDAAVKSHGEEKKSGPFVRFVNWPILSLITMGAFAIQWTYNKINQAEGLYKSLSGGGGGGGGHSSHEKKDSHGGGHGKGGH